MTRKHFRAVAADIAAMEDRKAAQAFATTFERLAIAANPRFDSARFRKAAGL